MKAKARDAKTLESERKRTGAGPPLPEMGSVDSQVIAIMPTIEVPIDSDTIKGKRQGGTGQEDNDKRARQDTVEVNDEIIVSNKSPITEIPMDAPGPSKEVNQGQKKIFDELKYELLVQELNQNKKKNELEMACLKEKQKLELQFIKAKQKLELEILEIRKMKELEK